MGEGMGAEPDMDHPQGGAAAHDTDKHSGNMDTVQL